MPWRWIIPKPCIWFLNYTLILIIEILVVERKCREQTSDASKTLIPFSPSHCAVVRGNLDSVKYLLQFRANMWMKNKRGDCPVHEAIQSLSHPSTPEQEDKDRQKRINIFGKKNPKKTVNDLEALFSAILRYLFDLYPEHIHIRNDERRTPLHLAASLGEIDTCQLLLECGARIHSLIRTSAVRSNLLITPVVIFLLLTSSVQLSFLPWWCAHSLQL